MNKDSKEELILKLFDQDISNEEFDHLQELMRTDPQMKELYYKQVALDHSLAELIGEPALMPTQRKVGASRELSNKKTLQWSALAAVAILMLGITVAWFTFLADPEPHAFMRFTQHSIWELNGKKVDEVDRLSEGQELSIESGAVELALAKGVIGVIEGPARVYIESESELRLVEGRGSFAVPESGIGFTVVTDRLRAIDLGTQFTVVAGWGDKDEIHVHKGKVKVQAAAGSQQILTQSQAVAVENGGDVITSEYQSNLYTGALPYSVKTLVIDDFESGNCQDGQVKNSGLMGWTKIGDSEGAGSYNPEGRGRFYEDDSLEDSAEGRGMLSGMRGPSIAHIYGNTWGGFERPVGIINSGAMYSAQFALGVRKEGKGIYAGYTIALLSGDTVLKSMRSDAQPGAYGSFTNVTLQWDSSELPDGVHVGDPLKVQIKSNTQRGDDYEYLDFDNFRMTEMLRSSSDDK